MKTLSFRFDIDTDHCFDKGVPSILKLSEKYSCGFTFFANVGRAVSRVSSIKGLFCGGKNVSQRSEKLGAVQKFGALPVIRIALLNKYVASNASVAKRLSGSGCEVGLHGGLNHAAWQREAHLWSRDEIESEVSWAVSQFQSIFGFKPLSFSSPGWNSPMALSGVLAQMDFRYFADIHGTTDKSVCRNAYLPNMVTQLTGEPGGVGYIESLHARHFNSGGLVRKFIADLQECLQLCDHAVVYDHPGYCGVKAYPVLEQMIRAAVSEGVQIIKMDEYVEAAGTG